MPGETLKLFADILQERVRKLEERFGAQYPRLDEGDSIGKFTDAAYSQWFIASVPKAYRGEFYSVAREFGLQHWIGSSTAVRKFALLSLAGALALPAREINAEFSIWGWDFREIVATVRSRQDEIGIPTVDGSWDGLDVFP
jgi:hypothetical protein